MTTSNYLSAIFIVNFTFHFYCLFYMLFSNKINGIAIISLFYLQHTKIVNLMKLLELLAGLVLVVGNLN